MFHKEKGNKMPPMTCGPKGDATRICVDSQIWHLPRPIGLTGRVDRLDRSGLYSPSRIRFFVKSPHVILLVKGVRLPRPINIKAKAD